MKILFMHPNFPGQYKHLARHFGANPKNQVVFLTRNITTEIPGVKVIKYQVTRHPHHETHKYLIPYARGVLFGQEAFRVAKKLKDEQGFIPDVICAHPGWGDAMFMKDLFPDTPILNFTEFYYRAFGSDMYFFPDEEFDYDDVARVRVKNSINLLSLEQCDWAIAPTFWQQQQNPKEFLPKISVLHDGIDTDKLAPRPASSVQLPSGKVLTPGDKVITYVARNFEAYRGFPQVMRALDKITRQRKDVYVVIVGNDGVSYGKPLPNKQTYKNMMLEELKPDLSRMEFINFLPFDDYMKVFRVSSAHIYYTVPFVLSWSMVESMASGSILLSSKTQPVEEVITHGYNGLLADFFDVDALVENMHYALDNQDKLEYMRHNARQTAVDRYSLNNVMPLHISLIEDLASKNIPPAADKKIKDFHADYMKKEAKEIKTHNKELANV